jgi:Alkylmercury lyase
LLEPGDEDVRGALTRLIARLGHAPSIELLAQECNRSSIDVGAALERLHEAHALLLHPGSRRPWAVHPFALAPGSCWVETQPHGYWANCLYCALGVAAAVRADAVISTRLGGEAEPVRYRVRGGELVDRDGVFHLSTPVAQWWDDVIFACSSFQPFRAEADVDAWCARHALPRGAVLTLPQLWSFARDWYGSYLDAPWRKRTAAEAAALFARHGLTGAFWAI